MPSKGTPLNPCRSPEQRGCSRPTHHHPEEYFDRNLLVHIHKSTSMFFKLSRFCVDFERFRKKSLIRTLHPRERGVVPQPVNPSLSNASWMACMYSRATADSPPPVEIRLPVLSFSSWPRKMCIRCKATYAIGFRCSSSASHPFSKHSMAPFRPSIDLASAQPFLLETKP